MVLLATSLHHTISLAARPTRLYRLTKGRLPKLPPDSFFVSSALPTALLPPSSPRPDRRLAALGWRHCPHQSGSPPRVDIAIPTTSRSASGPHHLDTRCRPSSVRIAGGPPQVGGHYPTRVRSDVRPSSGRYSTPAAHRNRRPPIARVDRPAHRRSRGMDPQSLTAPGRLPNDAGPRTRNRLPAVARIAGPPLTADLCAISAHGRHRFARRWPHLQHPASISSLGHQFGEKIQFRFSYCSGRDARPICWTG